MDADLHAVLGIAKLDASMRTRSMIDGVLTKSFIDSHPSLIRMLQSPRMDPNIIVPLVDRLVAVREGRQDVHEASVAVGQTLVNAYISMSGVESNRTEQT